MERRLAAILAADVVGYSRLMSEDEAGTLERLKALRKNLVQPSIAKRKGRIVKLMGDGLLAEFSSVVEAVQCAVDIQVQMSRRENGTPDERRIKLRIGINLGDVIVEGSDIYGDGVNVAARLEGLAEPGGICISGASFDAVEGKLDLTFVDMGLQKVKNISKPVHAYFVRLAESTADISSGSSIKDLPPLPDRPSIAVLPFRNMSGDVEQEYFADGMVEEIITALSRIRWLFVIARNSSFTYKGRAVDVKQVGRELGVRYVLEGSVRKTSNRVRISGQLIDTSTGAHLWGERYDRDLADTFALQDEITDSVVGALEPELQRVEQERAARKSPESMGAWDYFMRGMWRFYQFSSDDQVQAERLMRQAIKLDPKHALGHIGLARVLVAKILWGWSDNLEADRQAAHSAGRRAVELDEKEPYGHYTLAWASLLMGQQEVALNEAQKAIDLVPNFALAYFVLGAIRIFLGQFDQASDPIHRAMRLSPHEPLKFYIYNFLALARYHQGHFEEAARIARMGIAVRPFHMLYRTLAASYGQLGLTKEAHAALADLQRLLPKDAARQWEISNPYVDPAHRARLIEGLRKAGQPE
jgi:adenylate cyclase